MKCTDYFSNFYISRNSGGILGHKSKEKIPEYFFKAALPEEHQEMLPTSSNTYGKWFSGARQPDGAIWGAVASFFDEDGFIDKIFRDLNDSELEVVMSRFGIELQQEAPDKRIFACALAKQFYSIAQGNGETTAEAKNYYRPNAHIASFPEYVKRTTAKYEKIRTPFSEGEERLIDDIYVCNKLSSRLTTTRNRNRGTQETIILDATLDQIAEYAKNAILVANGGMGKTMLLQHLFLESIRKHAQTGILPVIIELRDFSEGDDLLDDHIIKTVGIYDEALTDEKVKELMISGKIQILMDGADEIDPSDEKAFQRKLAELVNRYPYNQYVMASRECGLIRGVTGFSRMYLHPFSKEQASALIDNLLTGYDDEAVIEEIKKYIEGDFLGRHKVFASNPMLLTFVIMKYPMEESFDGQKKQFYRSVYDAIVYGHDEEKEGYSRVFRSAQNANEFTTVFGELCAVTYLKHEIAFDLDTFDAYFNNLLTRNNVENPKAMTSKNFIHDACATACMMYEQETKILYIDSGFQEYLFARYYYFAAPEELIALGQSLWDVAETTFEGLDAFEMLNEFSSEKYENCFLMPFLHNIFQSKDESTQFLTFLRYGYRDLEYQMVDLDCVAACMVKNDSEWTSPKTIVTEPSSLVFSMTLRHLGIPGLLGLAVFEDTLDYPEFMSAGIYGELYLDPADGKKRIVPRWLLKRDAQDLQAYEKTHPTKDFVRDDAGQLVCFGREYKVNFKGVLETPHRYTDLVNFLRTPIEDVWKTFCRVKEFYDEFKNRYDSLEGSFIGHER
ncbi:NACHT domain-containing protein [Eubacteriales bacterium OttesenSCG-928-N13]|nr:NACHT domain-containing protein [Eubacteriales bacterium OttesenSCG-928-N13]